MTQKGLRSNVYQTHSVWEISSAMTAAEIDFDETQERLQISWDNRKVRKDSGLFWILLLFWVLWAPLTLFVLAMIYYGDNPIFFMIWSVFGLLGTVGIPVLLWRRSSREWIIFDAGRLSFGGSRSWPTRGTTVLVVNIIEIGFGWFDDESCATLSVLEGGKRFPRRHLLAYWLSKEHKARIFSAIREFALKNSISLKFST